MTIDLTWARFSRGAGLDHLRLGITTACGLVVPSSAVFSNRAHHPCRACEAKHPGRVELIERVLDFLIQSPAFEAGTSYATKLSDKLTAWDFDGAEPFVDTSLTHGGLTTIQGADPADIRWPPDIRIMRPFAQQPDRWALQRFKGLRPQDTRGRFAPPLPFASELILAEPVTSSASRLFMGRVGFGRWTILETHENRLHRHTAADAGINETASEIANLSIGIAKLRRSQWRVYLGIDDRPGITLPTSPSGAREVFRLRDIPEGRARRTALHHWVSEHWRTNYVEPEEELLVRAHLRGETKFVWNGLRCNIAPSEVDQELNVELRDKRREAAVTGTDRRQSR